MGKVIAVQIRPEFEKVTPDFLIGINSSRLRQSDYFSSPSSISLLGSLLTGISEGCKCKVMREPTRDEISRGYSFGGRVGNEFRIIRYQYRGGHMIIEGSDWNYYPIEAIGKPNE